MATMYCALCERPVEARRHIGVGTLALGFVTGGLWFLAIPFYVKRCAICKSSAVSATSPDGRAMSHVASGQGQASYIAELNRRLNATVEQLESAHDEIERLRTEQDFYRELLGDRIPAERRRLREK